MQCRHIRCGPTGLRSGQRAKVFLSTSQQIRFILNSLSYTRNEPGGEKLWRGRNVPLPEEKLLAELKKTA